MDGPVAWRFDVELPQPEGGVLPRVCYVKLPDRDKAVKALVREHPKANFPIHRAKPVSNDALDEAFHGDSFLLDEEVRCVQPS